MYTFDITQFHKLTLPYNLQWWVFLAFFLGFAIKVPMFPFHTWLPDAHTDAPTAGSVILAAVLLKMGTYGFLRFSLPDPAGRDAARSCRWSRSSRIVGIVYGALVALAQKDWKRLVAYSSVSHMAMVMLGMFALNPVGITGSIVQQLNHGISTGALFLIVGIVYERRHTREISEYGGLSKVMPVYAAIFLVMTLSSIGLPALNGFIGEFLILQGVFVASKVWAAFAASGVVLGAAYMLYLYQRTMFGKIENPKNETLLDLSHREFATFAPLLILAVWMGLYSVAVPPAAGHLGAAHHRARQPAVCSQERCGLRDPCPRGGQSGGEIPRVAAVRSRRQASRGSGTVRQRRRYPASRAHRPDVSGRLGTTTGGARGRPLMPAGLSASDFYYILPELVLTAGALVVLIADVLLPRGSRALAWVTAAGDRRHVRVARPVRPHPRRGGPRADRGRSVRALLQDRVPRAPRH